MNAWSPGPAGTARGMRSKSIPALVIISVVLSALGGIAFAAQDRFTLKAPNGIAFSEFRGYETWQDIAVSQVDDGLKIIQGNAVMMKAYRQGIPGNGKPFPEGSAVVMIEWSKKQSPAAPYKVMAPDNLKTLSFILKDSKRFPDTGGWGYAQLVYDAASDSFKPFGADGSFGKEYCFKCHVVVKAHDHIFTAYPRR